eukprot:4647253-Prymnesium_polylepis.1
MSHVQTPPHTRHTQSGPACVLARTRCARCGRGTCDHSRTSPLPRRRHATSAVPPSTSTSGTGPA